MKWKSDMCSCCGSCEFSIARECEFYRPNDHNGCDNYEAKSTYEYWDEGDYDDDYDE